MMGGDLHQALGDEGIGSHGTQILALAGTDGNGAVLHIREAQMQKVPYMLVIGDRDMENGTVSVRTRKGEDLGAMTPDAFIAKCLMEIATKSKEV